MDNIIRVLLKSEILSFSNRPDSVGPSRNHKLMVSHAKAQFIFTRTFVVFGDSVVIVAVLLCCLRFLAWRWSVRSFVLCGE